MSKKATIEDVARLARVSPATVSRVMNRTAKVSAATEKRVRTVAEKLGFELRRRSSNRLIAFLLANRPLLHPFHSQVLVTAEEYCSTHDYSVLFFPLHYPKTADWRQLHVPRIFGRPDIVDGFIVAGVNYQNLLMLLSESRLPFVVFGDTVQGDWDATTCDVVNLDDIRGAFDLTADLQRLGHKRIWYVANTNLSWFARRLEGYSEAMKDAALLPLVAHVDSTDEQEIGFLATKRILADDRGVQAVFAGSDAICHGVYAALREVGLRVPEDLSVAGFNDTPEATVLHPPLTTVRVFPGQIGRAMASMLMKRIQEPHLPRQEQLIPTQIVRRESCRALEPVASLLPSPRDRAVVRQ